VPDNTPINFAAIVMPVIEHYMSETNTPGMSAALVCANQTPQTFVKGYVDTEQSAPVDMDTVFGIGSCTKVFTAILLQSKVHARQMKLGDLVTKYLPNVTGTGISSVTLKELATHTAGMPNEAPGKPATELFTDQSPSTTLVNWWETFQPQPAVGQCWRYSNAGFVTLGFAVGGSPNTYNTQLASVITTPLKMPNTSPNSVPKTFPVAQGYRGTPQTTTAVTHPAVDLYSNAADMLNFLNACVFPDVSTAIGAAIRGTQKSHFQGNDCDSHKPLKFQQGLAWQISEMTAGGNSYPVFAKDGAASGYEAWIGVSPNLTGIALLSNKAVTGSLGQITVRGRKILQDILNVISAGNG
jgi:beta-lactamase class C